jgi:hypothetical protein
VRPWDQVASKLDVINIWFPICLSCTSHDAHVLARKHSGEPLQFPLRDPECEAHRTFAGVIEWYHLCRIYAELDGVAVTLYTRVYETGGRCPSDNHEVFPRLPSIMIMV